MSPDNCYRVIFSNVLTSNCMKFVSADRCSNHAIMTVDLLNRVTTSTPE